MKFKLNIIVPVLFILVVGSFVAFSFRSNTSTGSRNYDGTYSGKINYEYQVDDGHCFAPSSVWIPASFDLAVTFKGDEITHVYSSEPGFGTGPNGVVPIVNKTSVTLEVGAGGDMHIGFPNGTFLSLSSVYLSEKDPELITFNPSILTDHDAEFVNHYWFWTSGGSGGAISPFTAKTLNRPGKEWCDERPKGWSLRKVSP